MYYRITVENSYGTRYSWTEDNLVEYYKDGLSSQPVYYIRENGEWKSPFPNEPDNCEAVGIIEELLQSDDCPISFYNSRIVYVKVEEVD